MNLPRALTEVPNWDEPKFEEPLAVGADSDGDGVIDPWDCQPFNPAEQGWFDDKAWSHARRQKQQRKQQQGKQWQELRRQRRQRRQAQPSSQSQSTAPKESGLAAFMRRRAVNAARNPGRQRR